MGGDNIKTIFFDVGGVLIRDFSATDKWDEMLDDLGLTESQKQIYFDSSNYENSNSLIEKALSNLS
jgi:ribonucleotide monophosphatase NagD (HAD superfamily)